MKNTDIKSEIKKIISDYKDIMSKDLQQALENLHDEIESETKRLKRIHINMHKIRANKKNGTKEPVITIKTSKKNDNLSTKIKSGITKKIEKKKTEIRKLQALYSKPGALPGAIKTQVAMKIERKKIELKNIYSEPKDVFTLERVGRWSVVQVVKLFLGMPIIPVK